MEHLDFDEMELEELIAILGHANEYADNNVPVVATRNHLMVEVVDQCQLYHIDDDLWHNRKRCRQGHRRDLGGHLYPDQRVAVLLDYAPSFQCRSCKGWYYKEDLGLLRNKKQNTPGPYCKACNKFDEHICFDYNLYDYKAESGFLKAFVQGRQSHSVTNRAGGFWHYYGPVKIVINRDFCLQDNMNVRLVAQHHVTNQLTYLREDPVVSCVLDTGEFEEGFRPMSHPDAWTWLFPDLFPSGRGAWRQGIDKTSIQDWLKMNLFAHDLRFAQHKTFLPFIFHQMESIRGFQTASHRLRHQYFELLHRPAIVSDVLDRSSVPWSYDKLATVCVSAVLRGSSQYKINRYLDLKTLIAQRGPPTLFLTFSTNAFGWLGMRELLQKHGKQDLMENPVLYAQYFHHRWTTFTREYLMKVFKRKVGGFDWYYWVLESNKNGMLHVHLVIKTGHSVSTMIDNNIIRSTVVGAPSDVLERLNRFQQHHCTSYCLVNGRCRFNYPRQLNSETKVIIDMNGSEKIVYKTLIPMDQRLVNSNDDLLECWGASMEMQYLTFGNCAKYINKYMSKTRDTNWDRVPYNPHSTGDMRTRCSIMEYLNTWEYSKPMLTFLTMGWAVSWMSVEVDYIPAAVPKQNAGTLRPVRILAEMDLDDKRVAYLDRVKRFFLRPSIVDGVPVEHISYFDFWCHFGCSEKSDQLGDIKYRRRKTPIVVRSYFCDLDKDEERFYMQHLMWYSSLRFQNESEIGDHPLKGDHDSYRSAFMACQDLDLEFRNMISITSRSRQPEIQNQRHPPSSGSSSQSCNGVYPTLTPGQQDAFDFIMAEDACTIIGVPGAGKSHVLRATRQHLLSLGKYVFATAPTGIAALSIGGQTIQSLLRLHRASDGTSKDVWRSAITALNQLGIPDETPATQVVLLLDEIGYVSAAALQAIDILFRCIFSATEKFMGGIKFIAFGDYWQCEPPRGEFSFQYRPFREQPVWNVQCSYRHRNDIRVPNLLEAIKNDASDQEIEVMLQPLWNRAPNDNFVTLVPTREQVDVKNKAKLDALPGQLWAYSETSFYVGKQEHHLNRHVILHDDEMKHLAQRLELKVNARVLLIQNMTLSDCTELKNGMFGKVMKCELDGVWVKFDMVPDREVFLPRVMAMEHSTGYTRFQIPLLLAWCVTIHRIQSQTLPGINLVLVPSFTHGLAYSGLGRSTSYDNISLDPEVTVDMIKRSLNNEVRQYYAEKDL
jgi:ATP-dependent DNA helicase PIF1